MLQRAPSRLYRGRFVEPNSATTTKPVVDFNPFPGLRPFREEEEHLFFGRESQVDALLEKLADALLLTVMGASGSGKSSLVSCGLIPALRGGLMAHAGPAWKVASFRPGGNPIKALAQALASALFDAADHAPDAEAVETTLRASKRGLIEVYKQALLPEEVNLLVVVDQFEEVFRLGQMRAEQDEPVAEQDDRAFVNLLLEARKNPEVPVFVTLTMRSDFLEDCRQFTGLPEAINAGQYLVPRMTREERRAAIAGPVAVGGAMLAPDLLTRLVNDAGDALDQLPVLQHALSQTWEQWYRQQEGRQEKTPLSLAHYEAIGPRARAFDAQAEQAYARLDSERKRQICEKVFKALTYKGSDMRSVRRPTKLVTLCALTGASEAAAIAEVIEVIDVFREPCRSFLTPPLPETLRAETVVDIAHESLMRMWERLKHWVDDEAESARMYRRLAEAALSYEAGQTSLWRDPDLQLAEDWREAESPTKHWGLQYHTGYEAAMAFVDASLVLRKEEAGAAAALQQRELDRATALAATKVESAQRFRTFFLVAAACAAFALLMALFAWNTRQHVRDELAEAERRHHAAVVVRDSLQAALDYATAQRLEVERLLALADADAAEAMRQKELAEIALSDAERLRRNAETAQQTQTTTSVFGSTITQQQRRQALGRVLAGSALVELQNGNKTRGAMLAREAFLFHQSSGGAFLKDAYEALRQVLNSLQPQLGGPQKARWEATVNGYVAGSTTQASSPDGQLWARGFPDGTLLVRAGDGVVALRGHQGPITKTLFSPDATLLASASLDGSVRLWPINPDTRKLAEHPGLVLDEHTDGVIDLYFTGNSEALVTRSADQTVRRWPVKPERLAEAVCAVMGRGFSLTQAEWERFVGSDIDYDEHRPCPE